jgi:hypothetical protein
MAVQSCQHAINQAVSAGRFLDKLLPRLWAYQVMN